MFARITSPGSSPGSSTSTRCMWTPNVPLYSGVWRASTYRWMRLVLPTARSPTTLIFSFRRRIRKEPATRWPASKGLRASYHALNSANGTLGRDRTGGNPSSAVGGIAFPKMDSSGAKITLDQESFKALASDVRVGILKRLDVRRETVTDLSNLMTLSKPTLLEHLEKLQSAGLVKRVDEGRKWIYYELSDKGRKILHPERVAITLVLGLAVALAAIGAFLVISASSGGLGAAPMYNASAPAASAPSTFGGPLGFAVLAFTLSVLSGLVALALRLVGQKRRGQVLRPLRVAVPPLPPRGPGNRHWGAAASPR